MSTRPLLRILHVEDDPSIVVLVKAFADKIAIVESAGTLAEARARLCDLTSPSYDLLLVDLQLPDARDIEVITALRPYRIPIVVMSGVDTPDVLTRAARAGADDYLVKPVEKRADLVERLMFVHNRHRNAMCRGGATVGARIGESTFELLKPFITCDTRAPFATT